MELFPPPDFDFGGGTGGIPDVPEPSGGIPLPGPNDAPVGTEPPAPTAQPPWDPGTTTTPDQGKGFGDLAKAARGIAGDILPFVGIGTAGMGLAAGIQGAKTNAQNARTQRQALDLQKQVAAQQAASAAPLTQFGQEELNLARAGNVPPAVQAEIDQLVAGYKQKINDFAARSGQGDSSMIREWMNWADQQGLAMKSAWIQQQQAQGVSALTAGASAFGGAGQTARGIETGAENQTVAITQLMEQANKALASLTAEAS